MKPLLLALVFLLVGFSEVLAQNYVHVTANSLNLRESPSTNSQILQRLSRYENLVILEESAEWVKVQNKSTSGYVYASYVKSGHAKVTTVQGGRTGAICKDGSRSNATGRGACSHHGGVSYWIHSESQSVSITPNSILEE